MLHMVAQAPPDPERASKKLSGALSAEALRKQLPEIYSPSAQGNPRDQINQFMDRLGLKAGNLCRYTSWAKYH